jgi:pimeloyl-ACP methyl ester carboxylesterase
MAADRVELMCALGFARFRLAGHDRGARVAHRPCLDHADAVVRVAMLDISPTRIMCGRTDKAFATAYCHWFFLIQPFDLPERLIGADPAFYLRRKLAGWSSGIEHFDARAGRIRALFQRSGDDSCELRGLPRRGGDATLSRNVGERNCGARQDAGWSIGEAALPLPCRSMRRSACCRLRHHGRRRRTLTAPFAAA